MSILKTSPEKERPNPIDVSHCKDRITQQKYQSSKLSRANVAIYSYARKNSYCQKSYQEEIHKNCQHQGARKSLQELGEGDTCEPSVHNNQPPNRPPRASLQKQSPQFDEYLYQSQHITTPIITALLTLDFPQSQQLTRQPQQL